MKMLDIDQELALGHNELRSMRLAISRRIDRALNFSASRDARGDRASCDFKLGLMAARVAR